MPTLLLTGARGLVGDSILRHFHNAGWHVVAACSGRVVGAAKGVEAIPFDLDHVGENRELAAAVRNSEAIIHCAALLPSSALMKSPQGGRELYNKNTKGTYELMEMAAQAGAKTFIFMSSANLYKIAPDVIEEEIEVSPSDPYMLSKVVGEVAAGMFSRASRTVFHSLRISAPYGARFTTKAVIPTFVTRALAGDAIELMGTGKRQQVFTYVDDVARACMSAIHVGASGTYNIAGAETISMEKLARSVLHAVGQPDGVIVFTGQPDPNEGARRNISLKLAKHSLGWQPKFNIESGLNRMVAEMREPFPALLSPLS